MDIKVEKGSIDGTNYFEKYARQSLQKYFNNYPFVESIRVFFRGKKHPYKKVKLQARLKGKDVFVEGTGARHDLALDVDLPFFLNFLQHFFLQDLAINTNIC